MSMNYKMKLGVHFGHKEVLSFLNVLFATTKIQRHFWNRFQGKDKFSKGLFIETFF